MKFLNKLILTVLTAALIVCMASCAKPDKPEPPETGKPENPTAEVTAAPADPTDTPADSQEPEETQAPEETAAPTDEPTAAPPSKPALGDNKGKPFTEGQEHVDTLYFEDFNGKTVDDLLEDAGTLSTDLLEVNDGKLCLSFVSGVPEVNHNSFFAQIFDEFGDYEQFELSFDYKIALPRNDLKQYEWAGLMIGCFVNEPTGFVPTTAGNGLFFGLNDKGRFPVYGVGESGSEGGWPDKSMILEFGQKDYFDEERHVTMIQTDDLKAYLYIDGTFVCHMEVGEDEVTLFDASGNKVASAENNVGNMSGSAMMVWTHLTGAVIDNFCVKAY